MRCLWLACVLLTLPWVAGAQTPTPTVTLTPTTRPAVYIQYDVAIVPTATPRPTAAAHTSTFVQYDVPLNLLTPSPSPTGPTRTPSTTPTATTQPTFTFTPTPTCPAVCTISGIVYRVNGDRDANDTLTFFSGITHPVTLAGCLVQPMPPVSTNTDAQGVMRPIRLPYGLPISVTLANGGGSPVQSYVPYEPAADIAAVLTEAALGHAASLGGLAVPNGPVDFGAEPLTNVGQIDLTQHHLADLGAASPAGTMKFCADCQGTNPCTVGGGGALAVAVGGVWSCTP